MVSLVSISMAKKSIPLVTGQKYHVYNRGVDKRVIFSDKSDYLRFYLSMDYFNCVDVTTEFNRASTQKNKQEDKLVQLHAYCLLNNHFHLIIEQLKDGGISEFMKRVSVGYTGYFNEKNNRLGSLFQGTYKRVHIKTDEQANYLFAYVNENHIVHGVGEPSDIFATSAKHYELSMQSKVLPKSTKLISRKENQKLAKTIFDRRVFLKKELFEL